MFRSGIYYLRNHPVLSSEVRADYSYFPSSRRLAPVVHQALRTSTTPIFILDAAIMRERLDHAEQTLGQYWKRYRIAYSFKTNYVPVSILRRWGVYAEVTSERELRLALAHGYAGSRIVFNGPHKTAEAVRLARKKGVLIQVDNVPELIGLGALPEHRGAPIRFGCRMRLASPRLPVSHFGMTREELFRPDVLALLRRRKGMRFEGVHFHIGTDIEHVSAFAHAAGAAGDMIRDLVAERVRVGYVNLGGGVVSHGRRPFRKRAWKPYAFSEYARVMSKTLQDRYEGTGNLTAYIEPGRYIIDDAMVFVTRVLRAHVRREKQVIYADGTTAMLPLVHYRPQIVRAFTSGFTPHTSMIRPTKVYGASCREDDVLFRGWQPALSPGDVLIFYCVGAYNQSLGTDFIFRKPDTRVLS